MMRCGTDLNPTTNCRSKASRHFIIALMPRVIVRIVCQYGGLIFVTFMNSWIVNITVGREVSVDPPGFAPVKRFFHVHCSRS